MTVLIAPDKFKGSLTARQVVDALARGLAARGTPSRGLPLADGGDGSVQAALHAGFTPVEISVTGPTGKPHQATIATDGTTAIIEVANTCGLSVLPDGALAPLEASTRGVGDAIVAALGLGSTRLVLALGGSASTDGGAGMLTALGIDFRDRDGHTVDVNGGSLRQIHSVDRSGLIDLRHVQIIIASDVENPLTGPDGAASVYGPQKGATAADIQDLDAGLTNLVHRLEAADWGDATALADRPGAGSAGGLGFASMLLGGRLVSGADFFLDLLDFDTHVRGCDLVITGEGKLDSQTLAGKLLTIVTRRSGTIPVIAVVGHSEVNASELEAMGIDAVYALSELTDEDCARDSALSAQLLEDLGRRIPLPTRRQHHPAAPAGSPSN
jgi:glycerate kinase